MASLHNGNTSHWIEIGQNRHLKKLDHQPMCSDHAFLICLLRQSLVYRLCIFLFSCCIGRFLVGSFPSFLICLLNELVPWFSILITTCARATLLSYDRRIHRLCAFSEVLICLLACSWALICSLACLFSN